jgi:hypothetical protein
MILGSFAQQIQEGAKMEVKHDSIWFRELGNLSTWQKLKNSGSRAEFKSFEDKELGDRDAWQFNNTLPVKVISFDPQTNQAKVEMLISGKYHGSQWWIDGSALSK